MCTDMLCLCSNTFCCYDHTSDKMKLSSKGLIKKFLEEIDDGPIEKYRKELGEAINLTSTNKGLRTINHMFATIELVNNR